MSSSGNQPNTNEQGRPHSALEGISPQVKHEWWRVVCTCSFVCYQGSEIQDRLHPCTKWYKLGCLAGVALGPGAPFQWGQTRKHDQKMKAPINWFWWVEPWPYLGIESIFFIQLRSALPSNWQDTLMQIMGTLHFCSDRLKNNQCTYHLSIKASWAGLITLRTTLKSDLPYIYSQLPYKFTVSWLHN